jgi:mono/diheme cytochrome c family protein
MRRRIGWTAAAAVLLLGACGRGRPPSDAEPGAPAEAAAEAGRPVQAAAVGKLPPGVSGEMGKQGQELYLRACVMCHGQNAGGTPLGPSLTDREWTEGNGSFEEIIQLVRNGVPAPKQFEVPMPARGDGTFTDDQVRAVAAYTYSIANPR